LIFADIILHIIGNTADTDNLVAQGIGMVGLTFAIISFQNNKRNLILIFLGLAQMCFIVHYALLEVWPAFAVNIVAVVRTFSFLLRGKKKWMEKNTLMYIFIGLFCIAVVLSWNGWISLLPVVAMTVETIGLWKKKPRLIRSIVIIPRPLWIIYNTIHHSYPGVLTELFVVGSLITGIVRFDILPWVRQKKIPKQKKNNL
jgi:hypothetical protein